MAGCLLAALTYFPIFKALTALRATRRSTRAQAKHQVVVHRRSRRAARSSSTRSRARSTSRTLVRHRQARAGAELGAATPTRRRRPARVAHGQDRRQGRSRRSTATAVDAEFDAQGARIAALQEGPRRRAQGRGLSGQGRSGAHEQADGGRAAADGPGDLRDDGLRPDRGDAGRDVPDPHPLHLDVPAVPHRQRLVRRLAADHRVRDRGGDRQHVLRPVVSDRHRGDDAS